MFSTPRLIYVFSLSLGTDFGEFEKGVDCSDWLPGGGGGGVGGAGGGGG